jgi:pyrroloquinoline quinone biosynthesis protein D
MTESANKTIWKVDSGVRFRRLFDEAVLIHQENAEALVLNDTAISFIEACDGERTVDEIISGMVEDFEVSAGDLAADLGAFIEQLEQEGIIEAVPQ